MLTPDTPLIQTEIRPVNRYSKCSFFYLVYGFLQVFFALLLPYKDRYCPDLRLAFLAFGICDVTVSILDFSIKSNTPLRIGKCTLRLTEIFTFLFLLLVKEAKKSKEEDFCALFYLQENSIFFALVLLTMISSAFSCLFSFFRL